MITPAHLGGHFDTTNTDEATLVYLIERYAITSMLDVGCGPGGMLDLARSHGLIAQGIDGDPNLIHPDVFHHDYTFGPLIWPKVDLIWCVEFVEHIEARYIPNFLATFRAGRVLLLSHALPGQGGHHHVNEQPRAYWAHHLSRTGFEEDAVATTWLRHNALNRYIQATGMVWTHSPSA